MVSAEEEPTQQEFNSQQMQRKLTKSVSGLAKEDVADVICILHPASPAAFRIVADTAQRQRQHILQQNNFIEYDGPSQISASEAATLLQDQGGGATEAQDLALRFSSHVNNPAVGFCFGRNLMKCDINLDPDHRQNRISNMQFRIYCNGLGIVMLEDMSTNGTVVDKMTLGGKRHPENPKTQMLSGGSIIEILSMNAEEHVKFIVRIPSREPHQDQFIANFQNYIANLEIAKDRDRAAQQGPPMPDAAVRGMLAAPLAGPANPKKFAHTGKPIINNSNYGMKWDGGDTYNCVGLLGKGAFATVYQLATRSTGELYAAKELEKRRFVKNGQLDQRLENEMQIMKDLKHENIVKYIDYVETDHHLYIIMEYVPCGDLQGYMQSHGTLPEDMGRDMTTQILKALSYLHQRSITHRDIKPDNILIQSEYPFEVKLTDFGLSKVVKNNETFLKTFCGTLLYCAPEVFPDWHKQPASRQRPKRRAPGSRSSHSYSQLVDVWSYAAVLWFVMCGKPPYEGIVDRGGQAMFNKIMTTPLDVQPLLDCKISDDAIDLLMLMLDTNPGTRPSELDCLRHPWLNGGTALLLKQAGEGLLPITEEAPASGDEDDLGLDASQLSIHDREKLHSSPDELHLQHTSKRTKADENRPVRGVVPRQDAVVGAVDASWQSVPLVMGRERLQAAEGAPKPPKLFGEISQAALRSSGVFGGHEHIAGGDSEAWRSGSAAADPSIPDTEYGNVSADHGQPADVEMSQDDDDDGDRSRVKELRAEAVKTNVTSLNGAESMVREMHMTSPQTSGSQAETPDEPHTPKTPTRSGDLGSGRPSQEARSGRRYLGSQDETPKRAFDRHIHVPPSPSVWYDPYDKSTHNLEHASQASGINFLDEEVVAKLSDRDSFPASFTGFPVPGSYSHPPPTSLDKDKENEGPLSASAPPVMEDKLPADSIAGVREAEKSGAEAAEAMAPPPSRIGCLTATPGSFVALKLPLIYTKTWWGRNPLNQLVYPDPMDTRVPKMAFCIYFWERGVAEPNDSAANDKPPDPAAMGRQWAWICAASRTPLFINGVRLDSVDADGHGLYGKLYTGDEINAVRGADGSSSLTFRFEAFAGRSTATRPVGSRFAIETRLPLEGAT